MFDIINNRIKDLTEFQKLDFLKRHRILTHYPYELPLQTELLKEQMIFSQKKQNIVFLQEIKNLATLAEQNKIDLIFFKGVSLAKEVYVDFDKRLTGDIDVLIMPQNLARFIHILKAHGGYKDFTFDIEEESNKHIKGRGSHFPPLDKEVFFEGIKYIFHLEVHVRMTTIDLRDHNCTSNIDEFKLVEHIISRARWFKLNIEEKKSIDIKVMDIYDSLIILVLHMVKHLLWDLTKTIFHGRSFFFNIQLILDLINFWTKYKNNINYEMLYSRIEEYDVLNAFLIGRRIVDNLYQEFLGNMFRDKCLITTENHSITSGLLHNLNYLNADDIIFLSSDKLFDKIINSKKFADDCYAKVNKQPIEQTVISASPYGSCYNSRGEKISSDIQMHFEISCDSNCLHFCIDVKNKNYIFENTCLNDMCLCDTIQLNFLSNTPNETGRYDRCFRVCFEDAPSAYLKDCSEREWINISKQICNISVNTKNNGYSVMFSIPWRVMGIKYVENGTLLLMLSLKNYNIKSNETTLLTHNIANRCFGYFSIYEYICIKM